MQLLLKNSFYGLIVMLIVFGCSNKTNPKASIADTEIQIISTAPQIPVLKRMDANALVRIRVYIPAKTPVKNYRSITATLNLDAIGAVEELQIYANGTEPLFNTK